MRKLIMKKKYSLTIGLALVCAMLFFACDNVSEESEISIPQTPIESGYGRISIGFTGEDIAPQTETPSMSRTVLPQTVFDKYVYTFTKAGESTGVEKEPDNNGYFTLEVGSYTVAVQAYVGTAEPYTLAASGVSPQFSVGSGSSSQVLVPLTRVTTATKGKFSYTITYPAGAAAKITLQKWPDMNNITVSPSILAVGNGITETLQLEADIYFLTIFITKDEFYAGIIEVVHINPLVITEYIRNFDDNDLIAAIPVTNAEIIITAPVKGEAPDTTAISTGNFSVGNVT